MNIISDAKYYATYEDIVSPRSVTAFKKSLTIGFTSFSGVNRELFVSYKNIYIKKSLKNLVV